MPGTQPAGVPSQRPAVSLVSLKWSSGDTTTAVVVSALKKTVGPPSAPNVRFLFAPTNSPCQDISPLRATVRMAGKFVLSPSNE